MDGAPWHLRAAQARHASGTRNAGENARIPDCVKAGRRHRWFSFPTSGTRLYHAGMRPWTLISLCIGMLCASCACDSEPEAPVQAAATPPSAVPSASNSAPEQRKPPSNAEVFVVGMKATTRINLGNAVKREPGVAGKEPYLAVVHYTDGVLEILEGCGVPGSYQLEENTVDTQTKVVENAAELKGSVPLLWAAWASKLEGELKGSESLAIKYSIVGKRTANVTFAHKNQVQGIPGAPLAALWACGRATHLIRVAWVGAFETKQSTKVGASGGAQVLTGNASGGGQTSDFESSEAGNIDECKKTPPSQCDAVVRLELVPLFTLVPTQNAGARSQGTGPQLQRLGGPSQTSVPLQRTGGQLPTGGQ